MMLGHSTLRWDRAGPQALSKGAAVFSHGHSQLYWLLARREWGGHLTTSVKQEFSHNYKVLGTPAMFNFSRFRNFTIWH